MKLEILKEEQQKESPEIRAIADNFNKEANTLVNNIRNAKGDEAANNIDKQLQDMSKALKDDSGNDPLQPHIDNLYNRINEQEAAPKNALQQIDKIVGFAKEYADRKKLEQAKGV